jgi:hypothetical protein
VIAVRGTLWLLAWLRDRWASQGALLTMAGRASYATYFVHPLLLTILSVLLAPIALAPELKFVVVAPVAVPAIFAVGYALTRVPGISKSLAARYLSDSGAASAIVLDRLWLGLKDAALPPTLRHLVVADVADALPLPLRIGSLVTRRGARVERFAAGTPGFVLAFACSRLSAPPLPGALTCWRSGCHTRLANLSWSTYERQPKAC